MKLSTESVESIARDIIKDVLADANENNVEPIDQWNDAHTDYLIEHMPYDVRQLEGRGGKRDHKAEEIVGLKVESILEQEQL